MKNPEPNRSISDQEYHQLVANGKILESIRANGVEILDELNEIRSDAKNNAAALATALGAMTVLLQQIADGLAPEPVLTASAPIVISGEGTPMANNTYKMNVGQSQAGVITPLLQDGVTPSGGVVSGTVVTFNDPSASFVLAPDNITITFTGLAANTAPMSGSVSFSVQDSDGVVSTWSDPITVEVDAVTPPPQQLTQSAPIVVGVATP